MQEKFMKVIAFSLSTLLSLRQATGQLLVSLTFFGYTLTLTG